MNWADFTDYLKIEKNYSDHTVTAYVNDLTAFAGFIAVNFSEENLKSANYSMVRSWIVEMVNQGISAKTVNRKISSLQAYYKFLLQTRQLKKSPLAKHKSLKTPKKVQIPFSREEIQRVFALEMPDDYEGCRDRLIIELFYATGMRRAELMTVKTTDLDMEKRILKVTGKGNKERLIPLVSSLTASLEAYMEKRKELEIIQDKDYLLLTQKGKKLYDTLVYRVVNKYFSEVSTKLKTSPHILRHSFATHLLNEGADINSIKSLLGHESLSSTQVYTHNDIASLRRTYQAYHPRATEAEKRDKTPGSKDKQGGGTDF